MPDMNMQTFEELQRHQLVTEFDIQSQSDLDDYQVKLNNVSNPTQAQDNLVVGTNGESLPHWNENVDFDTWVKIQISASSGRGLFIHGNSGLSSGSNGVDVFNYYDGFNRADNDTIGEGWTESVNNAEIVSNKLKLYKGATTTNTLQHSTSITGIEIYEFVVNFDTFSNYNYFGLFGNTINKRWGLRVESITPGRVILLCGVGGDFTGTIATLSLNTDYKFGMLYDVSGNTVAIYLDDLLIYNAIGPYATSSLSNVITHSYGSGGVYTIDDTRLRTVAAVEPTVQISTPKNISTALKSFGRAG